MHRDVWRWSQGLLWANGVMTEPWAGQVPFNHIFGPRRISDTGQVIGVGEYFISTGREIVPISWKNGTVSTAFENGFCPGKCFVLLRAVNNLGHVVGEAVNIGGSGLTSKATMWRDGVATNLGLLSGSNGSTATNISDRGEVVGNSTVNGGMSRAFAWRDGTIRDLGRLGGETSTAAAINENGLIVGSAQNAAGGTRAVLYSDGSVTDLNDLILGNSGWVLVGATDINDAGQIVGYGLFQSRTRAFLLTPAPSGVEPHVGGNAGSITTTIGGQFVPGVTAHLSCSDQPDILGTSIRLRTGGRVLTVTFDLRGTRPSVCDVVVANPDGSQLMRLVGGFTIEQGGKADIWVDIVGFDTVRPGRSQAFYIVYGNRGNRDLYDVPLFITVPRLTESSVDVRAIPPLQPIPDWLSRLTFEGDLGVVTPIWLYSIPAGFSGQIVIKLNASPVLSRVFIRAEMMTAELGDFSRTGESASLPGHLDLLIQEVAAQITAQLGAHAANSLGQQVAATAANCADLPPEVQEACTADRLREWLPQLYEIVKDLPWQSWLAAVIGGALLIVGAVAFNGSVLAVGAAILLLDAALTGWHLRELGHLGDKVITERHMDVVGSADPNNKVGSQGVGEQQYMAGATPLRYAIFFENKDTATAPAQEVVITDQLDLSRLDLDTFSLGPMGFGDHLVTPEQFQKTFTTTVDLRPAQDLIVRINGNLNASTGLLSWKLAALDPATNLPPEDPTEGFLPPGVGGSVFFTVMPKASLPTGTEIQNQASIVFDVNAPILTQVWTNTLDGSAPTSSVVALPPTVSSTSFPVSWAGSDPGAGIQDFSVFVSDNGGPFTAFQTNTTASSATFTGQPGHTYAFYSIARDLVGNVESPKTNAEATTAVLADTTPPVIIPHLVGVLGANGWYLGDVGISWDVTDPESGVASSSGCSPTNLIADTAGVTLTCLPTNGVGLSASKSVSLKLDRVEPPISCTATPNTIWPPNGNMIHVNVPVNVTDSLSGPAGFKLTSILSNEPGAGQVEGFTPGTASTSGLLKAERLGAGTGRVYTLTYEGSDKAGNTATCTTTVTVPHDQRQQ